MSDQRSSLDDAPDPVCAAPQRFGSFCAAVMSSPRSRSRSSGVKIATPKMLVDAPLILVQVFHAAGTPVLALQPGAGAPRKGIALGGHSSKHQVANCFGATCAVYTGRYTPLPQTTCGHNCLRKRADAERWQAQNCRATPSAWRDAAESASCRPLTTG